MQLIELLRNDNYDLVLFACSRTDNLEAIAKLVKRIRTGVEDLPPIALGGLVVSLVDRAKEVTDVDLVSSDVKVAYRMCERWKLKRKASART